MSKLFKLKEWLTVPDAAKHLSIAFGEEVTEADVLRLALDGHLKLSVNFVNHTLAKSGRIVSLEETDWFQGPPISRHPTEINTNYLTATEAILEKATELLSNKPENKKKKKKSKFEDEIFPKLEKLVNKLSANKKRPEKNNKKKNKEFTKENQILNEVIQGLTPAEKEYIEKLNNVSNIDTCKVVNMPAKYQALFDQMSLVDQLKEILCQQSLFMRSLYFANDQYLNFNKEIEYIEGVWDLPMIGGERLDIEHSYQYMTDGPNVTLSCIDGCFVEKPDGKVCWLQESNEENQFISGSRAFCKKMENFPQKMNFSEKETEEFLSGLKKARQDFIESKKSQSIESNHYPAGGLPSDSVLVVRTAALRELEDSMNETTENPLSTTERRTLLTIIATLCDYSAIPYQERGAAAQISRLTEEIGVPVSDDAIREALKKIPDALEARSK